MEINHWIISLAVPLELIPSYFSYAFYYTSFAIWRIWMFAPHSQISNVA
jgi:hypothetical protein